MNEDFKYIAAIAEHGSISKAARAVHISQPGLSQRLKRLEAQLGVDLFDRASMPLRPTDAGEVYLKYALRALAAENDMRREVRGAANARMRQLRVGVSTPRANALLTVPIVSFYETHRGCTIELIDMRTLDQLHHLFLGDKIDFAVLTPISPDPTTYDLEVLCHEQLLVVASEKLGAPQLARARDGRIGIGALEGLPFILPTCGDYYDPIIDHVIDSAHAQLETVVRDCSAELALRLVREGLGASIVPSTWVAGAAGAGLRTFELDGVQAGAVLRYIRRADRAVPDEEALFMRILRDSLNGRL